MPDKTTPRPDQGATPTRTRLDRLKAGVSMYRSAEYGPRSEALAADVWRLLSGGERDTMLALVRGPVWVGDLPSKAARTILVDIGLASTAVVGYEQGHYVANHDGWEVWKYGTKVYPRDPEASP